MNIPNTLANDLKQYLSSQAQQGDRAAQNLLEQLQQLEREALTNPGQVWFSAPLGTEELGC